MLLKNFKKSEEINHFSRESKDLMTEMGNNEIFEFNETSSKYNVPIAPYIGKLVSYTAHAENVCSPRR